MGSRLVVFFNCSETFRLVCAYFERGLSLGASYRFRSVSSYRKQLRRLRLPPLRTSSCFSQQITTGLFIWFRKTNHDYFALTGIETCWWIFSNVTSETLFPFFTNPIIRAFDRIPCFCVCCMGNDIFFKR
jgi:hypothetical protein